MGPDAAENSKHRLNEQRRLHHATVEKVPQRIKVTDIVAFDLETRVVLCAGGENVFDVSKGVFEHAFAGAFQIRLLPIVFELTLEPWDHRVEPEIHCAHIERGDIRLEG